MKRLLLLAPALSLFRSNFLGIGQAGVRKWEQVGHWEFQHYGDNRSRLLRSTFVQDARQYDETSLQLAIPIMIAHGTHDEWVDPHLSVLYSNRRRNVTLHLVDDDHSLLTSCTQVWDWLWKEIRPRHE